MTTFLSTLPTPLSAQGRQFFAIWHSWRRGRALPERRHVKIDELGPLARGHIMLEFRNREDIPILSVGPDLKEYTGIDLTGYNYLDLTNPENRALRAKLTLEQILQPCGFMLYYWLRYPDGSMVPLEFVGAPFCEDGAETPSFFISCATRLARVKGEGTADPDSWLIGEAMRFIDLGFGIPPADPSTPLNQLPAL